MANVFFQISLDSVDVRHLHYFAVVAEENNLCRAAARLFMAQPPLSRQIKQLEGRLGVALFVRHSKGLILTEEGSKVLEIIQPLLKMKEETFARLREEIHPGNQTLRIGFTTAFEQGVFARLEAALHERYGKRAQIIRAPSPKLANDVSKGRLNAAFVALPLDASGLEIRRLPFSEPLVAVLPSRWPEASALPRKGLLLKELNGKPLFWFKRELNPAFFDFAKSRFRQAGFIPRFTEEPAEHDVLLARIAAGEGMGLFAASFSVIKREGVLYADLAEKDIFHLQLGVAAAPAQINFSLALANSFSSFYPG